MVDAAVKPSAAWKIDPLAVDDTIESIRKDLASPVSKVVDDLRAMLMSGLLIRDNFNAAIVEVSCKHGSEAILSNPLKGKPLFFLPFNATTSNGTVYRIDGTPILRVRPDGLLGATVYYDLRHTEPYYERSHSVPQSIAHNSIQTVVFDTLGDVNGDSFSYNAGEFSVPTAGLYQITFKSQFENATFTSSALQIVTGTTRIADAYTPAALTGGMGIVTTAISQISNPASTTITVKAYHTNAAAAARNLLGNSSLNQMTRISIARLHNDSTPTCTVTGVLFGG
jgi:hypothetical protein